MNFLRQYMVGTKFTGRAHNRKASSATVSLSLGYGFSRTELWTKPCICVKKSIEYIQIINLEYTQPCLKPKILSYFVLNWVLNQKHGKINCGF